MELPPANLYFAAMKRLLVLTCFIFFLIPLCSLAQPGTDIDVDKPEQYETRTLGAEKTGNKKFTFPRKVFQNTVTHYNYYFNAANKLANIEERARQQQLEEDYTKLLPFFDYSLDATSTDNEIDSVIYKCHAGILLHDLRNSWVDDLYFLLGKAYYLRKDFDSANMVFRYINYAFAPKDDGYDIPIGSNASNEEHIFSISSKENRGFNKLMSKQPRRNEDLLWLARTYTAAGQAQTGIGLLQILKNDPIFPQRLQGELYLLLGYAYFTQENYDSAGVYLMKAGEHSESLSKKSRRKYLAAQCFQKAGLCHEATEAFESSASHAINPLMELHARLNAASCAMDSADNSEKRIQTVLSLAHREKFSSYRGLIYYTAARESIINKNASLQTKEYLQKSIRYSADDPNQKSDSYYLLGNIYYDLNDFEKARWAYDSVQLSSIKSEADQLVFNTRLEGLRKITDNFTLVRAQDSLQSVARMPEKQRTDYIRKLVKEKLKEAGLSEQESTDFINPAVQNDAGSIPSASDYSQQNPLISRGGGAGGDWYFNNTTLIANGFKAFTAKWGTRPNIDNWNRLEEVKKAAFDVQESQEDDQDSKSQTNNSSGNDSNKDQQDEDKEVEEVNSSEISYDAFLARLPLTEEKIQASNNKIVKAFFTNAEIFQNELENYPAALVMIDSMNRRLPGNKYEEQGLFNAFYCFSKIGKLSSADSAKTVLNNKYGHSKLAQTLAAPQSKLVNAGSTAATKAYESVYDLFIQGKFDEARLAKQSVDSVYGESMWTPQLLFIESVFYMSVREDSIALEKLTNLSQQAVGTPLGDKAERMRDVLSRRDEIESYLTQLQVTRNEENETSPVINLTPVQTTIEQKQDRQTRDSIVSKPNIITQQARVIVDSAKNESETATVRSYSFNPTETHYAVILLDAVAPVYIGECKNAFNRYNQVNFYNQKIATSTQKIDDRYSLVLLGPFKDAADATMYIDKVKPASTGRIIPWLKTDKYNFIIISQYNLNILSETKDMDTYRQLLKEALPEKF
jgi:hypothetical protein